MIQVQFVFGFQDYVHAQRLHAKQSAWRRFSHLLFRFIFPALGAIDILLGIWMLRDAITADALIVLGAGIFLSCFPLLIQLNWRYCYSRTRSNDGDCMFVFDDEHILASTSNTKSDVKWSAIRSFAEDQSAFLLYLAPAKFFPVPKRVCTPQQIDELRALVRAKLGSLQD